MLTERLPLVEIFQPTNILVGQNCPTVLELIRHVVAAIDVHLE